MLDAGDTAGAPVAAAERQRAAGEAEGGLEADVVKVSSSSSPSIDAVAAGNDASRLRALFCTLEFSSDTFSGNGTLAQACVRGLASAGVDVVCLAARPQSLDDDDDADGEEKVSSRDRLHGASALFEVPVPRSLWGRLDARSPWREFRDGAAARAPTLLLGPSPPPSQGSALPPPPLAPPPPPRGPGPSSSSSPSSSFDVVFAVDWTGVAAAEALLEAAAAAAATETGERRKRPPPVIYLNFRVFARSAETPLERELVRSAEGRAVALAAAASVALCDADAEDLLVLARGVQAVAGGDGEEGEGGGRPAMTVLLPPLRREFAEMPPPEEGEGEEEEEEEEDDDEREEGEDRPAATAASSESGEGGKENVDSSGGGNGVRQQQHQQHIPRRSSRDRRRNLLLCCVRLSPEKEPHRFVEVVEALARLGALRELNIVPALVGGGDGEYARGLRERMRRLRGGGGGGGGVGGAIVEGGFVGAAELASRFFDRAQLNFHPCLADAYGMSAVEAGSRGVPSVIHTESSGRAMTVGASALLREERGESVALDLSAPAAEVAARVAALLREGGGGAKTATAKAASEAGSVSLREVGERAQRRARSWGEREHGAALAALARRVASSSSSSGGVKL